jgi:hypothetical protein
MRNIYAFLHVNIFALMVFGSCTNDAKFSASGSQKIATSDDVTIETVITNAAPEAVNELETPTLPLALKPKSTLVVKPKYRCLADTPADLPYLKKIGELTLPMNPDYENNFLVRDNKIYIANMVINIADLVNPTSYHYRKIHQLEPHETYPHILLTPQTRSLTFAYGFGYRDNLILNGNVLVASANYDGLYFYSLGSGPLSGVPLSHVTWPGAQSWRIFSEGTTIYVPVRTPST